MHDNLVSFILQENSTIMVFDDNGLAGNYEITIPYDAGEKDFEVWLRTLTERCEAVKGCSQCEPAIFTSSIMTYPQYRSFRRSESGVPGRNWKCSPETVFGVLGAMTEIASSQMEPANYCIYVSRPMDRFLEVTIGETSREVAEILNTFHLSVDRIEDEMNKILKQEEYLIDEKEPIEILFDSSVGPGLIKKIIPVLLSSEEWKLTSTENRRN